MDFKNWQFNTRMNSWIMFFLSGLRTHKTMSMVATSPVWIVKEGFSIQINLSGCKAAKCGCSLCFTIKWKNVRNGWIVPFKVVNF